MPEVFVKSAGELFPIGNFKSTASEVQEPRPFAPGALQILMQAIIHVPSFTSHFDEIRVLHDLKVMRNRDDFCVEQFRNIADRQLPISQRIDDSQAMRITQGFESFGTKIRIKNFLCHNCSPFRNHILKIIRSYKLWYSQQSRVANRPGAKLEHRIDCPASYALKK